MKDDERQLASEGLAPNSPLGVGWRVSETWRMFWDDLTRRWRKEARAPSPQLLRSAGGLVAVLPTPRRRRRRRVVLLLLMLTAIIVLIVLGSDGAVASGTTITVSAYAGSSRSSPIT